MMLRIARTRLLAPTAVTLGRSGGTVAVAFIVNGGERSKDAASDEDLADDVIRQLRERLRT